MDHSLCWVSEFLGQGAIVCCLHWWPSKAVGWGGQAINVGPGLRVHVRSGDTLLSQCREGRQHPLHVAYFRQNDLI